MTVIDVDVLMEREIVQHLAKNAITVVEKTTSAKCVNPVRDSASLSQSVTQESQAQANGKCTKCRVHEINDECQNDMEDLSEQVQSLLLLIEMTKR